MKTVPYLLHALSPVHAGTGQAAGIIDLPIARMRSTGIPFVPGSSLKGVLREARRSGQTPSDRLAAVFGPLRRVPGPEGDTAVLDHAGALVVGDARLLALPVRSFRGTFAFVTSPLLLRLAHRDLAGVNGLPRPPEAIAGSEAKARVVDKSLNVPVDPKGKGPKVLYLEDLNLDATLNDPDANAWAEAIKKALPEDERDLFARRFALVDDETMTFLWETATQVDTRIRVDHTTGTVADGALWTEESLPAETLLVGLMSATAETSPRNDKDKLGEEELLNVALPARSTGEIIQLGGKATIGRGRCRLARWS
jgi:CRISPR-associated protein Cmr4